MLSTYFKFTESYYDALRCFETDEERGRFILGLCEFAFDDQVPDFKSSPTLDVAFTCIRDAVEEQMLISARSSLAGSRGGRGNRR